MRVPRAKVEGDHIIVTHWKKADRDWILAAFPDYHVTFVPPPAWPYDVLLGWVWMFGVWPVFDPGHSGRTFASVVDLTFHAVAFLALCRRWEVVRR